MVDLTLQLALENEQLKKKITQLETEVENLKKELRKPERMTAAENRAYWGIFGQILHFFLYNLPIDKRERKQYNGGRRSVEGAGILSRWQINQILCVNFVHFVYCMFSYNVVL